MSGEPPIPSGTVVPVRDGSQGLELLLLEKAARRSGKRGPWVFPGGKVEPADEAQGLDAPGRARRAAVREAREEAGLVLREEDLRLIARWVTPAVTPRRFDTWFFAVGVDASHEVRVDGAEIARHRWLAPARALEEVRGGGLRLAPPTFVTVHWLAEHREAAAALAALATEQVVAFHPRICPGPEGAVILYPGDAGYETGDPAARGPRHRLWAEAAGYRYERHGLAGPWGGPPTAR